jgi:7-keto-8-aminopelargonate synthetase-like enzyme
MREEPERVEHLSRIADYVRKGYRELGFNIGNSTTPIIPVIIGEQNLILYVWRRLFDEGVFVNPVLAPAVQPGRELLRTSYMATHTFEQMDRVLAVFEKVGKEVGLI